MSEATHSGYVGVRLTQGGRVYTYFNHDPTIAVGDAVVVDLGGKRVGDMNITTFKVGIVYEINPPQTMRARATKWIVCKVETAAYAAATELMKSMQGDDNG